jgi:hypothetical protein
VKKPSRQRLINKSLGQRTDENGLKKSGCSEHQKCWGMLKFTKFESYHLPRELFFIFFCDFDKILLWFCYDFLMGDFMFFLPLLKTVMISIWFSYGLGVFHFLLMKFVMAGRIFFVKKFILSFFWTFQNGKNNKLFVFKK